MVPAGINFIKASSIMWFFSTSLHYSLYFYYKTISFLFQKWFLPKIYLLFLVIITMHFRIDKFLLKIVKSEFLSARTLPSSSTISRHFIIVCINSTFFQQFFVCSTLCNPRISHYQYLICIADG